ncbi:MAG TPA: EAL domain-containing protein [Rhodopila sp.]|nr:EAL domain-containing protein [Rhodopila sp.]
MNKHRVFGAAATVCIGLVLSTLVGGSLLFLERTRQARLYAADITLQDAARVVERVVNRHLLQVDGALISLPDLFPIAAQEGRSIDSTSASRLLRASNHETFNFRDILLVQPDGRIWASARPNSWQGRFPLELLRSLDAAPVGAAALAGPVRNPVTGEWDLLLMRPVTLPGVGPMNAVAEIPLSLVTVLFSAVPEIPGLRIALERHDGRLIVSQPYDEVQIGMRQPAAISPIAPDGAPFVVPAGLFAVPTLGIARASLYPDLMIAVTLDLNTAMADWRRERKRLMAVVVVTIALLSALAMTLIVGRRTRERAEADRNRARAVLESAIESMSDGFVMWDSESRLVLCNQPFRDMYAVSADVIRPGALFEDIIRQGAELGQYPDAGDDIDSFVRATAAWRLNNNGPIERRLPNGRWALVTERRIPGGGSVGIRTDITNLKQAQASLEAANEKARRAMQEVELQNAALRDRDRALHVQNVLFDAALNNMSQGLLMIDGNQQVIVHNSRFLTLFGMDTSRIASAMSIDDLFAWLRTDGRLAMKLVDDIYIRQRQLADAVQPGTFVVTGDDNQSISISQRPILGGGWVATYEDVSEQRRAEEHIRFAAHHDALTKLPNRTLFRTRLDEMIAALGRRQTGLALLYLDLDRFKHVNDTLGHTIGDALLEAAGRRLLGCVRSSDVVARLGGDEFAIVYMSSNLPDAAIQVGQRIIGSLAEPYNLAGHAVTAGVSIGIALAFDAHTDADTLLKNADMALYRAKAQGRGICSLFEPEMEQELVARLAIEEDLRHALDREEFLMYYQPLWDLRSDRIVGFEALIRWNHPVRGFVPPIQFIHVAEETGLIRSIGAWTIQQACTDAMNFPAHTKMAVNLSAAQFDGGDIIEVITDALRSSGLPAHRLELEITETALLKNNEKTLAILSRLHAMGVRIALDDFGTGYSSLSYLRSFPFDKVKIDQSFVREMASRADCAAIVSSIVDLANKLDIITTAEGVETTELLDLVRAAGCTEAQGYLFSRPRCLREITAYFESQSHPAALTA